MTPSLNFMAIVLAFRNNCEHVESLEQFRCLSQELLLDVKPCVDVVLPLVKTSSSKANVQCRFDSLLSLAFDVGVDAFLSSVIPSLLLHSVSKAEMKKAFITIPAFEPDLRPNLVMQLKSYRMPLLSRRAYEYELFCGTASFAIDASGRGRYGFEPYVLDPFFRFLMSAAR